MSTIVEITYVGEERRGYKEDNVDEIWTQVLEEKERRARRLQKCNAKRNRIAQKRAFDWKKNKRPAPRCQRVW